MLIAILKNLFISLILFHYFTYFFIVLVVCFTLLLFICSLFFLASHTIFSWFYFSYFNGFWFFKWSLVRSMAFCNMQYIGFIISSGYHFMGSVSFSNHGWRWSIVKSHIWAFFTFAIDGFCHNLIWRCLFLWSNIDNGQNLLRHFFFYGYGLMWLDLIVGVLVFIGLVVANVHEVIEIINFYLSKGVIC
jgi:hypothetical protein